MEREIDAQVLKELRMNCDHGHPYVGHPQWEKEAWEKFAASAMQGLIGGDVDGDMKQINPQYVAEKAGRIASHLVYLEKLAFGIVAAGTPGT